MISGIFFFPILLDHGIFITEGWLISEGFKPYIDLFDNKPPAIYYLNSLKILLFETQLGWNFIDLLIYLSFIIAIWLLLENTKSSRPLLLASSVAYIYNPSIFEYGGLTEIYGSGLILFSMLFFNKERYLLSGIMIGLSVWFKEPFILFIFYPFFISSKSHNNKKYFIGAFISVGIGLLLLYSHGMLSAYIDIISKNIVYTNTNFYWENIIPKNLPDFIKIGFRLLPLPIASILIYKKKISMLSVYLVVVGIIAILIGKRFYGHYFLFLVPAWLNILIDLNKSYQINYYIKSGLKILIGFSLAVQIYAIQLQFPKLKYQKQIVKIFSSYFSSNETLLTEPANCFLYPSLKIMPADLINYSLLNLESFSKKEYQQLKENSKNRFNIHPPDYLYKPHNIFWFDTAWLINYEKTKIKDLFRKKNYN